MTTDYGPAAVWAVVLVVGVATFAVRFSFIYLFGRVDGVPSRLERALRFVPPAVLAALVAPALVSTPAAATGDAVIAALTDDRLLAGAVAAAVAWRTQRMVATVVVGMVAFWTLRFLL